MIRDPNIEIGKKMWRKVHRQMWYMPWRHDNWRCNWLNRYHACIFRLNEMPLWENKHMDWTCNVIFQMVDWGRLSKWKKIFSSRSLMDNYGKFYNWLCEQLKIESHILLEWQNKFGEISLLKIVSTKKRIWTGSHKIADD